MIPISQKPKFTEPHENDACTFTVLLEKLVYCSYPTSRFGSKNRRKNSCHKFDSKLWWNDPFFIHHLHLHGSETYSTSVNRSIGTRAHICWRSLLWISRDLVTWCWILILRQAHLQNGVPINRNRSRKRPLLIHGRLGLRMWC